LGFTTHHCWSSRISNFLKPQIKISNLFKKFPNSGELFNNLSLEILDGEFVALLGPSGCGKSTLLRMISGLEPFDLLKNSPPTLLENPYHCKDHNEQAMVFQDPSLIPWRTVLENVMLPFEIGHRNKNRTENQTEKNNLNLATESLDLVGLRSFSNLLPKELSGGMKMRVSLARALVQRPKLLLLDEPFAALDENTRERLQEDLMKIRLKFNMTVIFVTHSIPESVFLSDRIIILSSAPTRIVFDDTVYLPKLRTSELRSSAEFFYELKRIRSHFLQTKSQDV
jgi:NitT/TauT family transport system ATP-binding protein